ncbi:MAG: N-acetyltransferase, partial [Treponema sp.]
YFAVENEPTYKSIRGSWLNDEPYGLIHRLAVGVPKCGIAAFCLQWCFAAFANIRIDTHRDNTPMRNLLEKSGFIYCGTIFLADGSERLAYQKTAAGA